jgi:hypothetical protein
LLADQSANALQRRQMGCICQLLITTINMGGHLVMAKCLPLHPLVGRRLPQGTACTWCHRPGGTSRSCRGCRHCSPRCRTQGCRLRESDRQAHNNSMLVSTRLCTCKQMQNTFLSISGCRFTLRRAHAVLQHFTQQQPVGAHARKPAGGHVNIGTACKVSKEACTSSAVAKGYPPEHCSTAVCALSLVVDPVGHFVHTALIDSPALQWPTGHSSTGITTAASSGKALGSVMYPVPSVVLPVLDTSPKPGRT